MAQVHAKTSARCLICLQPPLSFGVGEDTRLYSRCCGQPLCAECVSDYADHGSVGCPACRSTQGILYITTDINRLSIVTLRLDGTFMQLYLSSRAMRRVKMDVQRDCEAFDMSDSHDEATYTAFVEANMEAIRQTTQNFIEQEALRNPALNKLIRGHMGTPQNGHADALTRWTHNGHLGAQW